MIIKITGSINATKIYLEFINYLPCLMLQTLQIELQNIGSLQVNGLEFTMNSDLIKTADLSTDNFNATPSARDYRFEFISSM
jgi:hypothetical protein